MQAARLIDRLTYVHLFDEPLVISSQGTIGDEIVRQSPVRLDAVFVPVGGGGLIAGIGSYVKVLTPEVRIVGVDLYESDAMYRSLAAGRRIRFDRVGILADGVAVRDTRTVAESAGALVVAGVRAAVMRDGISHQRFVVILSGRQDEFRSASFRLGAGRVRRGARGGVRRGDSGTTGGIQAARNYATMVLSADEMAMLHVRHLVGGRAPRSREEYLCRFECPERPGALM